MKETQCQMILKYLNDFGSITQLEAARDIGCYRLGARIFDLEQQGYFFDRKTEGCRNRYGKITTFTRYSLKEPEEEAV